MPQFARALDVYQGFNFKKDKQTPIGFITELEIGGTKLVADQETIKNPEEPAKDVKVLSVLNHFLWETGVTDAFYFSGQISTHNKQELAVMLLGDKWSNMEVKVKFEIFEYDPLDKKYFKSMFGDAVHEGILEKNGSEINLSVADDPSHEVQSPKNFTFQMGIKPATKAQTVNIATSHSKKLTKPWGLTEAK